ncbi:DIAP protein, partial [Rhadina sibilatrix]|nr:DIAP protein [Rhadina sibilatrix]
SIMYKAAFLVFLIIGAVVISTTEAGQVRVSACNEVCGRIARERDECCRAHGHSSYSSCRGGMICN